MHKIIIVTLFRLQEGYKFTIRNCSRDKEGSCYTKSFLVTFLVIDQKFQQIKYTA